MFRQVIVATTFACASLIALPALAQAAGTTVTRTPGTVEAVHTENVTATISAIDAKTRQVMLKGPQGKEFAVEAGPEVKNFAQLKVGDQVDVQYAEAVAVQLKKGGGAPVVASQQGGMVTAKPGAKPGAAAGRQVSVVGDVIDLDPATRTVTVRGPQRTASFVVEDPEQFKLIAKGDHIQATYTEAFAVAVTEAPKKK